MDISRQTLSNNLNTLFINSPGSTSASVQMWFRAGSALEQKENQGIAHFLEHMFFKGTKKRPGAKIAHEVESFGGEINAFTSFDYTCYYINTPNEHILKTADILMDMVSNPEFKQSELTPERQVVFEEYRRSQDNPNHFNFQHIQNASFPRGYKHPILGTPKTILNFTRKQLTEFRNSFYNTSNAMLVVAGDFNESKMGNLIQKYKMPKGPISLFPKFNLKKKPQVNVHNKQVRQASLTFSIQAPEYLSAESASEDLAINCLGYGETSRLYKDLVIQKSLASAVSGSSMFFSKKGIHFLKVVFPVDNFSKVLKELKNNFKDISKTGFQNFELEKIKNQYIASKVYEQESLEGSAFSLGHGFAQNGDINCEDQFIDLLKRTTLEQTNTSLKNIFSRSMHATLQLPEGVKTDKYKKELQNFCEKTPEVFQKHTVTPIQKGQASKYDQTVRIETPVPGITFLHKHNPTAPTFVLHSYIKGGLVDENNKNNGIHHLLAKGLTYGYKGIEYDELKLDLANKSASLSGFAGKNAYGLTSHAQSKDFVEMTDHFMQTLLTPSFKEEFIKHEKTLSLRMIDNQEENAVKQCFKKFSKTIFNDHHYALDIIGTKKSIESIGTKAIKGLHEKNLKDKEILITYCGSQSLEEVYPTIENYLRNLKPRKLKKTPVFKIGNIPSQNIDIDFDREQTQIFMGYPAFSISQKQHIYLKILSTHLSGQSSELFVDVRDRKGLCYAVQPVNFAALEAGYWGVYIGAGADKKQAAIEAISAIFKKLSTKGFKKSELNRVKKMMKGQQQLNIQTHNDFASMYSVPLLHGLGIDFPHKQLELVESITLEEFNKFLKSYFVKDPIVISVGPTNV